MKTVLEIKEATVKLKAFRQTMSFTLALSPAEKRIQKAAKIGPKRVRTIDQRIAAAQQFREMLPSTFDLPKLERDVAEMNALRECLDEIGGIYDEVEDTLLAASNRAFVGAATAHAFVKVAATAAAQLKRTVERLTPRRDRGLPKESELTILDRDLLGLKASELPAQAKPTRPLLGSVKAA